jgi:hypothetical protein
MTAGCVKQGQISPMLLFFIGSGPQSRSLTEQFAAWRILRELPRRRVFPTAIEEFLPLAFFAGCEWKLGAGLLSGALFHFDFFRV